MLPPFSVPLLLGLDRERVRDLSLFLFSSLGRMVTATVQQTGSTHRSRNQERTPTSSPILG